jgi:hypothetical protein
MDIDEFDTKNSVRIIDVVGSPVRPGVASHVQTPRSRAVATDAEIRNII